MQARYWIGALVFAILVTTGVLVYLGDRGARTTADEGVVTVTRTVPPSGTGSGESAPGDSGAGDSGPGGSAPGTASSGDGTSSTAETDGSGKADDQTSAAAPGSGGSDAPTRPKSNVPMTKLAPGEAAPQFVIFSFDGAGSHEKWHAFMDAAKPTDSRFTGFLSGIYLLDDDHASAYTGPGHTQGRASIAFGGSPDEVVTEVKDLNLAYSRGHEIGTHYNGHFCVGNDPSGDAWSTAQWNSELDQFFDFVKDWKSINGYTDAPELTVPPEAIKGGRTPCLEGDLEKLVPAWKKHGMTYDSSKNLYKGIGWPEQIDGIWEFQMPYIYSPGFESDVMAMDYNMWAKFNGAQEQPETAPKLREIVRKTYDYMFDEAYHGNRAPILIANHFNNWNGDSFNKPALAFMKDTCGKKDVYCATYSDVVDWMELQDPDVLAALQDQPVVATGA